MRIYKTKAVNNRRKRHPTSLKGKGAGVADNGAASLSVQVSVLAGSIRFSFPECG